MGAVKAAGGASGSRAKRISQLFRGSGAGGAGGPGTPGGAQRWASEKKLPELAAGVAPEPPLPTRAAVPPGVLKIFAAGLASGANYKSVLATERSTARELVAEALERYGLAGGRGAGDGGCVDAYALCDALGRPAAGVGGGEWRAEHLRVLADAERPLLVQDLWRARPGWARRFELRGREEARRLEQEAFGAADPDGKRGRAQRWGGAYTGEAWPWRCWGGAIKRGGARARGGASRMTGLTRGRGCGGVAYRERRRGLWDKSAGGRPLGGA